MTASSKEIADHLNLSIKTVEGYRKRLKQKIGASSRADLVRYTGMNGLLKNDE